MTLYWSDWAILVACLLGLGYLYGTWTYDYWKKRGVPFAKPTPFFGSMYKSTIGKQSIGQDLGDTYHELEKQGHSYGGIYVYRRPGLMILDPDLVKQILVKDFPHFTDNDLKVSIDVDPIFGRNPLVLKGDRWKKVRSQLTPAFTPAKLKSMFTLIDEVCVNMKTYLENDHPDGVEAKELCAKYTTDVVASCIFGINGNCFVDENAEFRVMGKAITDSDFWRNLEFIFVFLVPSLAKVLNVRFIPSKVTNFFRSVVKETTKYREEKNVTRNDILQVLLDLKVKSKFTDEDVLAQAANFFSDGFETSSGSMSYTLFEIASNKEVQERLQEEVDAVVKKQGKITYEMLMEMPYLDMVLSESLRMYPINPIFTRECTQPYTLATPSGGSYKVEVGTSVAIPTLWIQNNPKYFPEPERFLPERFSEANKSSTNQSAYVPFGSGPRICLGMRFAQLQIKAGIASIIQNFELRVCSRTTLPIAYEPAYLLMIAKNGLWLSFTPRIKST